MNDYGQHMVTTEVRKAIKALDADMNKATKAGLRAAAAKVKKAEVAHAPVLGGMVGPFANTAKGNKARASAVVSTARANYHGAQTRTGWAKGSTNMGAAVPGLLRDSIRAGRTKESFRANEYSVHVGPFGGGGYARVNLYRGKANAKYHFANAAFDEATVSMNDEFLKAYTKSLNKSRAA